MGQMTLDEMRSELSAIFADKGISNERLTRWINAAYFELCGSIMFEKLKCKRGFTTEAGVHIYAMPDSVLGFISVTDTTNKKRLTKLDTVDIGLQDIEEDTWSLPEKWSHRAGTFLIFPVPDDEYDIEAIYIKEPARLTAAADVTVLPATWDQPLITLAGSIGWATFDDAKADAAEARAERKIGKNRQDADFLAKTPALGLQVAWDLSDLQDQE